MVSTDLRASSLTAGFRVPSVLAQEIPVLPVRPPVINRGGPPVDWLLDESGAPLADEGGGALS